MTAGKNDTPTLLEVLQDKGLSKKFLEFLESEYCSENFLFWQSVERFREITDVDGISPLSLFFPFVIWLYM